MKKCYLFFAALFVAASISAQKPITGLQEIALPNVHTAQKTTGTDTLSSYFDRATAFYTLSADTAGYVLGTGSLTSETAVHFDGIGIATVTEVIVYFGHKTVMGGSADNIWAKFYSADSDTTPLMALDSASVNVDSIDVNGFATYIPFSGTGNASGDFLVSIAYGMADDTVAIISSNPVGSSPDGNGEKRTRQNTYQAGWVPAMDIWTVVGNDYDADAMIIPVVDFTVYRDQTVEIDHVSVSAPYPNPSVGEIRFPFALAGAATVRMQILNSAGQTVRSIETEMAAGEHEWAPALEVLPAGSYYFSLQTGKTRLATKFNLLR